MKTILIIIAILVVAGAIYYSVRGTNKTSKPNNQKAANEVVIENMEFSPKTLTVKAGTEVTFSNQDSVIHTVTADDNSFDSGNVASDSSYRHVFNLAGTYSYHCNLHPSMTAKIIVQ